MTFARAVADPDPAFAGSARSKKEAVAATNNDGTPVVTGAAIARLG
jgi:hypothetical protein